MKLLAFSVILLVTIVYLMSKSGNSTDIANSPLSVPALSSSLLDERHPVTDTDHLGNDPARATTYFDIEQGLPWKRDLSELDEFLRLYNRSSQSLMAAYFATDDASLRQELERGWSDDPEVAVFLGMTASDDEDREYWYMKLGELEPESATADLLLGGLHAKNGDQDAAMSFIKASVAKESKPLFASDARDLANEALMSGGLSSLASGALSSTFGVSAADGVSWASKAMHSHLRQLTKNEATTDEAMLEEISAVALPWISKIEELPLVESSLYAQLNIKGLEKLVFDSLPSDYIYESTGMSMSEMATNHGEESIQLSSLMQIRDERLPYVSETVKDMFWTRVRTSGELESLKWLATLAE